jgi:hypothetical protein
MAVATVKLNRAEAYPEVAKATAVSTALMPAHPLQENVDAGTQIVADVSLQIRSVALIA